MRGRGGRWAALVHGSRDDFSAVMSFGLGPRAWGFDMLGSRAAFSGCRVGGLGFGRV